MIFNQHTVGELDEFILYKDMLLDEYQKQFDAIPVVRTGRDEWQADFHKLKGGYALAKGLAQPKILAGHAAAMLPGVTTDIIVAEPEWQNITHSLEPVVGAITPGYVTDLYERLVQMGAKIDETKFPQPQAPDIDLEIYKKADAAAKVVEAAAAQTKKTATSPWLIGGLLAVAGVAGAAYLGWKPLTPKVNVPKIKTKWDPETKFFRPVDENGNFVAPKF